MRQTLRDVVRWEGTIDRRTYLTFGIALTAIKIGLDQAVARLGFGRDWTLFHYVIPDETFEIASLPPADQWFYGTMAVLALPFIAIGVVLTVKRLRDIPLPPWVGLLFFAPIPINVIFFLTIGVTARRGDRPKASGELAPVDDPCGPVTLEEVGFKVSPHRGPLGWIVPENRFLAALVAVLLPIPPAIALGYLSVGYFQNYGWGLFLGLPFALPAVSVLIYGLNTRRSVGECMLVGLLWFVLMNAVLLFLAFEGAVCLLLASLLVLPITLLGALFGCLLQALPRRPNEWSRLVIALLALVPAAIGAEAAAPRPVPLFAVRSSVDVAAPPDVVWKHVVAFSRLPEPDDWLFRTGIAYPVRAEIEGQGPGAVRRCVFSTGPFVEPIEVWDEPRLLRFAVTENPPPMREWSPIADIHPPHLDNYLVSRRGQFALSPLPGGGTRLEGTTWYHHNMWPSAYWRIWSDRIIGRIHLQVLRHVKQLAEADPTG